MRSIIPMFLCCVLVSCIQSGPSFRFVPITDPMFQSIYGTNAPTIERIFGGKGGVTLVDNPDSVTVFNLRGMQEDDATDMTTLGFFAAEGDGKTIPAEDYQPLFAQLRQLENYSDIFLAVTSADFGFKIITGTNVLDVIFDLQTPSVSIDRMQQSHSDRRGASPELVRLACRVADKYLQPGRPFAKRIGKWRLQPTGPRDGVPAAHDP